MHRMPAIDARLLRKAMDRAPMDAQLLTDELNKRGHEVSVDYVRNIVGGHRRVKRNAVLRKAIAEVLDVPVHWIEAERPDPEWVA